MDYLVITDNKKEQESIGRRIAEKKQNVYSKKMIDYINAVISKKLKSISPELLETEVFRSIYFYWAFGCTVDEYLYLGLFNKTAKQIKEYVTLHEKILYINHLNNSNNAHFLNNKFDAYCLLKEYFKRDMIKVATHEDFESFNCFVKKHPDFVVKPIDMGLGNGVHKASVEGLNDAQKKQFFLDLLKEGKENLSQYWYGKESALVLEELIEQDSSFAAFHPQSVNSVRITTVKVGDKINIYHPWFKIGRGGNFITSAAYGTFDAGIDVDTGLVTTAGFNEDFEVFKVHPETKLPIKGFQIPRWEEAKELAKEMASRIPDIAYVGWDIVLTPKGWCIMEGNYQGDFMWQLFNEKGNKKEFEELIGWKLKEDFWWKQ